MTFRVCNCYDPYKCRCGQLPWWQPIPWVPVPPYRPDTVTITTKERYPLQTVRTGTDITVILDESGSMDNIRDQTIKSFNSFLVEQQGNDDDECRLTLTTFNTVRVRALYENKDINEVPNLSRKTYKPEAGTPLYDAMGDGIERLLRQDEVASKVVIVIITDGEENSSRRFSHAKAKELVETAQGRGWTVIFLGANIDKAIGYSLGVNPGSTYTYYSTGAGVGSTMASVSSTISSNRSGIIDNYDLDEEALSVR